MQFLGTNWKFDSRGGVGHVNQKFVADMTILMGQTGDSVIDRV